MNQPQPLQETTQKAELPFLSGLTPTRQFQGWFTWILGKTARKWFCTPPFISDHRHGRVEGRGETEVSSHQGINKFLSSCCLLFLELDPSGSKVRISSPPPLKRINTQPRQPRTQPSGDSLQRIRSSFPVSWGSLLLDGWHQARGIRNYSTFRYLFIFSKRKLTPFLCCCTLWSLKCYSKNHGLSLLLTPVQYYFKKN